MNAQTNITAAPVVQNIEFSNLYVDDINPRTVVDDEAIAQLAANIANVGLIQNLAGYRTDGRDRVSIVAGGRRLRALALLQDDPRFQIIPVNVTTDPDVAQQWASSENAQRVDLHPAEEIRHYGKLADDKVEVSDIAVAYPLVTMILAHSSTMPRSATPAKTGRRPPRTSLAKWAARILSFCGPIFWALQPITRPSPALTS